LRIIATRTLKAYGSRHPAARASLMQWAATIEAQPFESMHDVLATFSKAKILNGERARFEVAGGDYRLIAAFDFGRQIAFVKFVGTHAEYDRVDAATVARF
jgi:mRNA interferase HigB